MAYKPHELSVIAYANGFTLWHYVTDDKLSDCMQMEYWQNEYVSEMLRRGDRIHVCCSDGAVDMVVSAIKLNKPESVRIYGMLVCYF